MPRILPFFSSSAERMVSSTPIPGEEASLGPSPVAVKGLPAASSPASRSFGARAPDVAGVGAWPSFESGTVEANDGACEGRRECEERYPPEAASTARRLPSG